MSELSKEEILKRAQSENKGRDFAELEAGRNDTAIAAAVTLILGTILCVIEIFIGKGINFALYIVITAMDFTVFLCKAIRKPIKENVITAVLFGTSVILFIVAWVISLLDL